MYVTTLAPHGVVLDAFRVTNRHQVARHALARVAKRQHLHAFENLGVDGFDTLYGAHEAQNGRGPVIVVIDPYGPDWKPKRGHRESPWRVKAAMAASPSARAARVERALFGV